MKLVKRFLKSLARRRRRLVYSQLGKVGCAAEKFWWSWKEGVRTQVNAYRANESLRDQIIEEIKEMEHKKTEEALELVRKENDLCRYQNEKEEAKRLHRHEIKEG